MVDNIFVGYINLKNYPKFEVFEYFSQRVGFDEVRNISTKVNQKIKVQFIKFIIHMIVSTLIGAALFYLGYYFYDKMLVFSIILSLFFVIVFMYVSKVREVKLKYFREFYAFLIRLLVRYCYETEKIVVEIKKNRILIFLAKA